jgi:hypothetical protein
MGENFVDQPFLTGNLVYILALASMILPILVMMRYQTVLWGLTYLFLVNCALCGFSDLVVAKTLGVTHPRLSAEPFLVVYAYTALGLLAAAAGVALAWRDLPARVAAYAQAVPPLARELPGGRFQERPAPMDIIASRNELFSQPFYFYCLMVSVFFTLIALPRIATIGAVLNIIREIIVIPGIGFIALYYRTGNPVYLVTVFSAVFLLGLFNAVSSGHVGYADLLLQCCVVTICWKGRLSARAVVSTVVAGVLLAYLFAGWMHSRNEIRQKDIGRGIVERMTEFVRRFEVPPIHESPEILHRYAMERLSFAKLHVAQYRHQPEREPYVGALELGTRLAVALVPRILWPSKPAKFGGSALVSRYTGLHFTEKTSVGAGVYLYLYAMGGLQVVLIGSFVIGYAMARAEMRLLLSPMPLPNRLGLLGALLLASAGGIEPVNYVWSGIIYYLSFYLVGYWYMIRRAPGGVATPIKPTPWTSRRGSGRRSSSRSSRERTRTGDSIASRAQ